MAFKEAPKATHINRYIKTIKSSNHIKTKIIYFILLLTDFGFSTFSHTVIVYFLSEVLSIPCFKSGQTQTQNNKPDAEIRPTQLHNVPARKETNFNFTS